MTHPATQTRDGVMILRLHCQTCGKVWQAESVEGEADRRCPLGDGFGLIVDRYDA